MLIDWFSLQCQKVGIHFGQADSFSLDAVKHYEGSLLQAKGDGVAVNFLLLCNSHNPLGD